MGATVRSPSGHSYTYNKGTFLERHDGYTDLRDKQGGRLLAQVPNTWLIEFESPCVIGKVPSSVDSSIQGLLNNNGDDLRRARSWELRKLKAALSKFNMHTKTWKP